MGCILISSDRSEGRCWQRLEDRWWWEVGLGAGRSGAGLWARSRPRSYEGEANWSDSDKWTISSPPTASFMPLKLLSHPPSPPYPPIIFFLSALNPIVFILTYRALFQHQFSLSYFFFYFPFVLPAMLFHFSASHCYLPLFSFLLCYFRSIGDFCIYKGPAAFHYAVISVGYLVHLKDSYAQ